MNRKDLPHRAALVIMLLAAGATAQGKSRVRATDLTGISVGERKVELTPASLSLSMDIRLDSLRLPSQGQVTLTPALRGEGEEARMPQVVVSGRRQEIDAERRGKRHTARGVTELRRRNGTAQAYTYTAQLPAESWMRNSDVVLYADLCGCGDPVSGQRSLVWKLRDPGLEYVRPEARPKRYELAGSAYIDFPVDRTELHPDYRRNPQELMKIVNTVNKVKEDRNATITSIEIKGWASPESPYDHNAMLAEGRALTLKDYVRGLLDLGDSLFTVSSVPENWQGLREYVEGSRLAHRAEILALIDSDMEPDAKEAQIKKTYPAEYQTLLEDCYPGLRRSDYKVAYTVRSFTAGEAREMLRTDPGHLSLEELFLVAQEERPGTEEFNEVFATAVRLFPDDPVANLNAACAEMEHGDMQTAGQHLQKAGDSPQALNARGVMAYRKGDAEGAERLFRKAAEAGCQTAADNLRALEAEY